MDHLKSKFGSLFTDYAFELNYYSRDLAYLPEFLLKFTAKTKPKYVFRPKNVSEVSEIILYAQEKKLPVTPRGGASTALGNCVPFNRGIVVDVNGLNGIISFNTQEETIKAYAGTTFSEVDAFLSSRGYAALSYPTSYYAATLGGWLSGRGYGMGSIAHGPFVNQVLALEAVLPDGRIEHITRSSKPPLEWFARSEGTLGIITALEIKVKPLPESQAHLILAGGDANVLLMAAGEAMAKNKEVIFNIHFNQKLLNETLKKAGLLSEDFVELHTLAVDLNGTSTQVNEAYQLLFKLAKKYGLRLLPEEKAREEWEQRFAVLKIMRVYPFILASEVIMPLDKYSVFLSELQRIGKSSHREIFSYGHIVDTNKIIAMALYRADEESPINYLMDTHLMWKIYQMAFALGGEPYLFGLWNTPYIKRVFSDTELKELRKRKEELDPYKIMNPGKLYNPPFFMNPFLFKIAMNTAGFLRKFTGAPKMLTEGSKAAYQGLKEELRICAACGSCRMVCPVYKELIWESSSPRGRITSSRTLINVKNPQPAEMYTTRAYQCTLCGACKEVCPAVIDTRKLWLDLRTNINDLGNSPKALDRLAENIISQGNVSGNPNENRLDWHEDLENEDYFQENQGAKTCYYVGCVASMYPMVMDIPVSFINILDKLNIAVASLGKEEQCCGFPLLASGKYTDFIKMARRNVKEIENRGFESLVTGCPGCYLTFREKYEHILGRPLKFKFVHTTMFLEQLIEEGVLNLSQYGSFKQTVTYHDPCDLGRIGGVYEAPRKILSHIPGITLVEMTHSREKSQCCGGGGNLQAVDQELTHAIAKKRIKEAVETGASILATSCQQCVQVLTEAARKNNAPIRVLDLTQLILEIMDS